MKYLALVLAVAACGDNENTAMHDAAPTVDSAFDFIPGCYDVAQTGPDMFMSPADFGAMDPGSLAGWDPNGRWFMTGTRVPRQSSYHFQTLGGGQVIVDRDAVNVATIDGDKIFYRASGTGENGEALVIAKRVANRLSDGTARAERASCDGMMCRVCAAKLVRAERFDAKPSENISLVGQLNGATWDAGFTFNVRVAGNTAYLIRIDGLHIIDVTDPANPVELGRWRRTGDGYSNDVKIVDAGAKRYALIADSPCDVVDVTNPAAPVLAAQIPEEAHTLFTETRNGSTYAYFGNYDGSTPIFDITNPAAPVRLGRFLAGDYVHDLSVANGIAYLSAWNEGLQAVDFTTPASPKLLGTWKTPRLSSHSNWTTTVAGRKIALSGDEAYGAHLDILDIDPTAASFMKPFATYKTRDHVSIHNIMVFGSKAYFTYYQDGVRVLDLADPTAPKLVGYYNTWDPQADYTSSAFFEGAVGIDVDLARKLIFIADSPRGLLILRDDTP